MTSDQRRTSNTRIIIGVAQIAVALMTYSWAQNHSPHKTFFETVKTFNSYILKEPLYSIALIAAALIAIGGIITIVKALMGSKS